MIVKTLEDTPPGTVVEIFSDSEPREQYLVIEYREDFKNSCLVSLRFGEFRNENEATLLIIKEKP